MQVTYKRFEDGKCLHSHKTLPYRCEPIPHAGDEVDLGDGVIYKVAVVRWTPGRYKIEVFVQPRITE